jgi:uncharacterized membrane protein HdeD (DUF308 family)
MESTMPPAFLAMTRKWWTSLVRGVAAIIFGIAAWLWQDLTISVLIGLFGAYALVDGILAVVAGLASRETNRRWWAELLTGGAGIALGIATFAWPERTGLVLLYLIAVWAIVTGLLEIVAAIQLRDAIDNEWLLGLGGVVSVIFGAVLFVFPSAGALEVRWMIGVYAILFGGVLIALSLRLRGLRAALAQGGAS